MKKGGHWLPFFIPLWGACCERKGLLGLSRFLFPRRESKLFAPLLGQGVAVFVLNQTVEVEVCDALTDARFAYVQVGVFFNALPEVPLQHGKSNVTLVLDFVLVDDVENHVVVLVQVVHSCRR